MQNNSEIHAWYSDNTHFSRSSKLGFCWCLKTKIIEGRGGRGEIERERKRKHFYAMVHYLKKTIMAGTR